MIARYVTLVLFFTAALLRAQSVDRRPGEVIVHLGSDVTLAQVLAKANALLPAGADVAWKKDAAAAWRMHVLHFDEAAVAPDEVYYVLRGLPGVQAVQWNVRTEDRGIEPNDPEWWRQSDMDLIGAPDAWEASTGGLTLSGDTIVVAILEKGALMSHPDLAPNRWYNIYEIPDNDIDDDQNGYIDDYAGWNPRTESDHPGNLGNHGTAVNGIVGAKGNNLQGVTGVSWDVKLMNLANVEYVDEIISAYEYVWKARRTYNATNGQKGAFVVAANSSFGIDFADAEDYPLWCAVYDSLGKVGVLGIAATSNQNVDVDTAGDMPTTCTSEFMIAVNNVDKLGNKVFLSGSGPVSVDLGAPGEGTYTTANFGSNNPGYGTLGGTSAATPHVSGSVALLYSLQCDVLTSDAISNPPGCARRVRDIILQNVTPEETLQGITVTGGYLNLAGSVNAVRTLCKASVGPLDILEVRSDRSSNMFTFFYQTPTFVEHTFRVFNMLGQLMYEEAVYPNQFAANSFVYDANILPAGVYVVTLNKGKDVTSTKILKI
jgi:subtilisin family serine protease